MSQTYPFKFCYRQIAYHRYVIISILAITIVVLLSMNEKNYMNDIGDVTNTDVIDRMDGLETMDVVKTGREFVSVSPGNKNGGSGMKKISVQQQEGHCPRRGQPSQVILLTYGRSGSSLTADILQRHDDVYFYYEPLHNLAKSYTRTQKMYEEKYLKHLYLTAIPDYNKDAERVCELLLTCNHTHLPLTSYRNLHLVRSLNTLPLHRCIRSTNDDEGLIQNCLGKSANRCTLKPFQLIKTIRMTAASVGNLMAKHPHLKMIYLMRDPRGSYLSKLKAFPRDFSKNATYEALRICPRLEKDISATLSLHQKYPGRVHITRYESIAEDPVGMSRKLYKFLCLEFTAAIENYIVHTNMGGTNYTDKNIYDVRRRDAKAASYAWRSKMDIRQATAFDEVCSQVYHKLGYLPVDNEDHLRDLDTPIKVDIESLS